ncbi:MAG: hypothetical protein K8J31_02595, partial [Anaerolineae bacterium]|nr:hypothetical protein [Anaerolineae bacterium]
AHAATGQPHAPRHPPGRTGPGRAAPDGHVSGRRKGEPRNYPGGNDPDRRSGRHGPEAVFVSNRGNVAVHIDTIGAVGLQEANLVCRALRAALQNTQEDDFDRVLDEVVGKLRDAYGDSGAVALRVRNDPLDLAPGQTAALNLSMTMPTAMRPTRRYTGAISLFNASINILVQPLTTETQGG